MMTQRCRRTWSTMSRVCQHRRPSKDKLTASSPKPSDKWAIRSWMISQIDSRNCADESVISTVHTLEETGKKQYQDYVKNVLDIRIRSIHDPSKRNSLALFKQPQCRQYLSKGRRSKFFRTTLHFLASYTYLYKTGIVT